MGHFIITMMHRILTIWASVDALSGILPVMVVQFAVPERRVTQAFSVTSAVSDVPRMVAGSGNTV